MVNGGATGIILAIDGPAASGKSSTAKAVAAELGYRHLDSGAFYRAITLAALDRGIDPEQWPDLTAEELRRLEVEATPGDAAYRLTIEGADVGERIRAPEVDAHVSRMAAVPAVRAWLLDSLRQAGRDGALVADGRDMGSVVFPNAELKVFLVCDPRVRARRRLLQQGVPSPTDTQIHAEAVGLAERDRRDRERQAAPLVRAPDAVVVDTTDLEFEEQVAEIVRLARDRIRALG